MQPTRTALGDSAAEPASDVLDELRSLRAEVAALRDALQQRETDP